MNKHDIHLIGISKFIKKGLTVVQSSLIFKQTSEEWKNIHDVDVDKIYCYINNEGKDIYAIGRLKSCCGPWLSVSCRSLRKKGYIAFDFNDEIEIPYGSGMKTAYRVLFSDTPKYEYDEEARHPVAYFEKYFK
ncbi:hypothetical protein [Aeromonas phage AS-szw]|uniref:Uncharacterized protein n=2 Tax=Caudoviricetes TaxID=2731619 RepID=A0A291LDH4_9CAUD|nr:hypothetical protein [Aeromonas phage AS-szw]